MALLDFTPFDTTLSQSTLSVQEGILPPPQNGNAIAVYLTATATATPVVSETPILLNIASGSVYFSLQGSQPIYVSFISGDLAGFPTENGQSVSTQGQWVYPNTPPTKCGFSLQAGNYSFSSPPTIFASIEAPIGTTVINILNVYQYPNTQATQQINVLGNVFTDHEGRVVEDFNNNTFID